MKTRYDIVIVGGGMVGAALAAALADSDLSIAVLERALPAPFEPEQHPDLRVSALSIASENIIRNVGAWDGIISRRACPFRRMRVWESSDQRAATEFDSNKGGEDHLGYIAENRVIQLALIDQVKTLSNVDLITPVKVSSIDYSPGASIVSLDDGREIVGRLLVGADGGASQVRQMAGIGVHTWDYNQHALVATVKTSYGQQDITWQQFTPTGPLAFLPLPGAHASLVWYNTPNNVRRLMALSDDEFMSELRNTFPERLGEIPELIERGFFPLRRQHAQHYCAEGVALAGDSAHMIHPLAGQGVNIGLLDAAALAETILDAHSRGERFETRKVLQKYERCRRQHNLLMMQTMDFFYRTFSNDIKPLKLVRNVGLGLAGHLPIAQKKVMRFAMGLEGPLPVLARSAS